MRLSTPGWYEILGAPNSGKTLLASLLCEPYARSIWLTSAQDHSPDLWTAMGWQPWKVYMPQRLDVALMTMRTVQRLAEIVVLDSMASLEAQSIATTMASGYYVPTCPTVVINQDRFPRPAGGMLWRRVCRTYRLELYRRRPALYSHMVHTDSWLVWGWGNRPTLRNLLEPDRLWVNDGSRKGG